MTKSLSWNLVIFQINCRDGKHIYSCQYKLGPENYSCIFIYSFLISKINQILSEESEVITYFTYHILHTIYTVYIQEDVPYNHSQASISTLDSLWWLLYLLLGTKIPKSNNTQKMFSTFTSGHNVFVFKQHRCFYKLLCPFVNMFVRMFFNNRWHFCL